jgi:hypothetical protein
MQNRFPMEPPEARDINESYILRVPVTDKHLSDREQLQTYAKQLLEKQLGDEVDLISLRVKKPNFVARLLAKLFNRTPQVKLYLTVKF